ncbi:MAG: sigma-70 family RNA polymerase sigma factor [Candidatus Eisenbacteria bacterium]
MAGSNRTREHTPSDGELVARVLAGDEASYGTLVTRYRDYVYTIAVRIVGNDEDAEDVAQEAFVRAYRALPRFRGDSKFSSWLYRIATNRALTHLKRRRRRGFAVDIESGSHVEADVVDDGRSQEMSPELTVRDGEFRRAVRAAVLELPEQYRVVVTLFYLEERSYKEVAATLGIPMGTLKTHLHRARALLRDILTKHDLESGR